MEDDLRIMLFSIVLPLAGMIANAITQIVSYRFFNMGYLNSLLIGPASGILFVVIIGLFFSDRNSVNYWDSGLVLVGALTIYLAAAFSFLIVVTAGESSIRIRMLREFATFPQGLTLNQLLERYNDIVILELRLERLQSHGKIKLVDGRYFLQSRSLHFIALLFKGLKLLLLKQSSEFESVRSD